MFRMIFGPINRLVVTPSGGLKLEERDTRVLDLILGVGGGVLLLILFVVIPSIVKK